MKRVKLSTKLMGGFLAMGLIILVGGFIGWYGVSKVVAVTERMSYAENIAKQILQRETDHFIWARKVGEFQRNEKMTELSVEKDEHNCVFGKWYYGEERKNAEAEIPEIAELLKQAEEPHRQLHNSAKELERMLQTGADRKDAVAYYGSVTSDSLKKLQGIMSEIVPKVIAHVDNEQKENRQHAARIKTIALIGMFMGVIVAVLLGLILSVSIVRPINHVVGGLSEGSSQLAAASEQVSSASQSLAEGASEQAASIEETSSSMEEMSSMTLKNADHADQANFLMADTTKVVEEANQAMQDLIRSMEEISEASEETGKIIKTIDEIAFQTNLLALNAAVEAARAGEAGAGFAVVADEVRNLAMRAADAAKNTANLIDGTVKKIKSGSETVSRTNDAFFKVAMGAKKVSDLVGEIAAASREQSQGIEQINKAVTEMDRVVQMNAASAEESASASEELKAQAGKMKGFVRELILLIGEKTDGEKGPTRNPRRGQGLPISGRQGRGIVRTTAIASARNRKDKGTAAVALKKKAPDPNDIIPLKEEGEFKDF